ncbi:hypothetical protein RJ640_015106 [Escallonia rubra]|uniref:J domain-containing protein n=1 Tax=Escallonia rubra TaxID=112253 RepID=A0AA88U952_9ASTE|nr:hypothetical protein RJ640_015106 [Escallonia rubra]
MTTDDWITVALHDDTVVVELLLRLKQSCSESSYPTNPLPPLRWGHRQPRRPRSKSAKKDGEPTRFSPTTPLSWSGGGSSASDGCEESSRPSDPSSAGRSKGTFASESASASANKRSRKKKTFTELKEQESLLLKERNHLKRELASVHMTLKEQRARSENLKRLKLDYNLQPRSKMGVAPDEPVASIFNQSNQMEESTSNHHPLILPRCSTHDDLASSSSCVLQEDAETQGRRFVLPDLNMPLDDEFVPETRCHYEVLGLGRDYIADEIRSAYCRLALQRHPDKLSQFGFSPTEDTVLMAPMPMVPWMSIPPSPKRQAVLSDADPNKPVFENPTYNGVIAEKVSGRRSSSSKVSLKRNTFEQRAKENEIKRAYKERITELKEEIRTNKVEKRKKRENKKKENILKFGTKLQKITNPKTGTVTPPQSRFSLAQTSISGGTNYRREVAGTDTTTSHKKKKKKRRRLPNRLSPSPSMSFAWHWAPKSSPSGMGLRAGGASLRDLFCR